MAYRHGRRHEQSLFPASIEDYVPDDAPVRAYDAFVDALDFGDLGIELDSGRVGNSSYDPRAMLKLLVYGYSYGVRSSRKLERETHYNLSFIWLTGGLKPDHKTIAELPFGHIKRNLNAGHFLLRGLDGVRAEASLLASCFNLARMITLLGVPALIAKLAN
jgi:transposase